MPMKQEHLPAVYVGIVEHFEDVLRGVRTGRANTALVQGLTVDVYGSPVRLRDIASLTTPDPKTIQIESWDHENISGIIKALEESSLGLTPAVAGSVIRLSIPPLTEERRHEFVKLVGKHAEDARVAVRMTREKLLKDLKKQNAAGELSDDAFAQRRADVQRDVDAGLAAIEERKKEKEQDLLSS